MRTKSEMIMRITELSEQLAEEKQKNEQLENEIRILQECVDILTVKNKELKNEVEVLRLEIEPLNQSNFDLLQENKELEEIVRNLKSRNNKEYKNE